MTLAALHARHDQLLTFCVHVHNRLPQLRLTLPANLEIVRGTPRVGLVLLDYNSHDGVDEWIRATCRDDLATGKLIYAHERTARYFHASKSKNLAHRIAPGRVLVNLDGDNFIGSSLPLLLQLATASDKLLVHVWSGDWSDGTYGRIAIARELFERIGGYDESLLPMAYQDTDLLARAREAGADLVEAVGAGFRADSGLRVEAIANTKRDTLRHTGYAMTYELMNRINQRLARHNRRRHGVRANPRGWGRATVEINFETELVLA